MAEITSHLYPLQQSLQSKNHPGAPRFLMVSAKQQKDLIKAKN